MGIEILLYIIIGGFAGMLAGLLGVGGGLIIVPCLVFIYTYLGFNEDILVHVAIGTSLASIIKPPPTPSKPARIPAKLPIII